MIILPKPFDTDILLAKLRAILARRDFQNGTRDIYEIGKFIFNSKLRTLTIGDDEKKLSPKEAQLLELLAVNPNALISREMALKKIWGNDDYFTARSMDVYITKLRKFLSEDPAAEYQEYTRSRIPADCQRGLTFRLFLLNSRGRRSSPFSIIFILFFPPRIILIFLPFLDSSSVITCRQFPHGETGSSVRPESVIAATARATGISPG